MTPSEAFKLAHADIPGEFGRFVALVHTLREKQREFFETRRPHLVKECRALERRVDSEIQRVWDYKILERENVQNSLDLGDET